MNRVHETQINLALEIAQRVKSQSDLKRLSLFVR